MEQLISVWLQFVLCVALIGVAGVRLSRYGDIIAEKTRTGGTWIGMVLLATVTSLPELVTGVSAVTVADVPNIAVGDVLGSCVFNLAILIVLDFLHRDESVYTRASQGHILSAAFGILLIGMVGFSLLLEQQGRMGRVAHVGFYTPAIVLLYLLAMRTVFRYQKHEMASFFEQRADRYPGVTLRQAVRGYAIAALVVLAAGSGLPFVGGRMAEAMGWHESFVGTLFVAFATSVPELAVTLAALRIGALDMAIGNVLGSNLFDILIIAVDDVFFVRGSILAHVASAHFASVISAMMMTGIVIVGLLYRPRRRLFRTVGWASLFLLAIYLVNAWVLYQHGQ
ncbi:MAG: cation transporter [Betaproteobacteria bacterium RIFCSPLOWO2_02_64_14]|nr:MAG: cation transporter [Betaproteobacteria bacterium RIFCSPLOWO2_02_64_14]